MSSSSFSRLAYTGPSVCTAKSIPFEAIGSFTPVDERNGFEAKEDAMVDFYARFLFAIVQSFRCHRLDSPYDGGAVNDDVTECNPRDLQLVHRRFSIGYDYKTNTAPQKSQPRFRSFTCRKDICQSLPKEIILRLMRTTVSCGSAEGRCSSFMNRRQTPNLRERLDEEK
jgi:hypothetical protein